MRWDRSCLFPKSCSFHFPWRSTVGVFASRGRNRMQYDENPERKRDQSSDSEPTIFAFGVMYKLSSMPPSKFQSPARARPERMFAGECPQARLLEIEASVSFNPCRLSASPARHTLTSILIVRPKRTAVGAHVSDAPWESKGRVIEASAVARFVRHVV